jgi:uncharacterized protein YdaU (DUF1376 family)
MKKNGLFVRYCAKDFLDGVQTLTVWEELAYRRICDLIYATGDALADDDHKLAWQTRMGDRWKRVKAALIAADKIRVEDGRIVNDRCRSELEKSAKKIAQCSEAGKASSEAKKSSCKSLETNDYDATDVSTDASTGDPTNGSTNQKANKSIILTSKEGDSSRARARAGLAGIGRAGNGHAPDKAERKAIWQGKIIAHAKVRLPDDAFEEFVAALLEEQVPPWARNAMEKFNKEMRRKSNGDQA